jgi:hypothetical protein
MQQRDGSYDYEGAKMKSVPRLYFDELDKNGDRSRHALWFEYRDLLDGQEEPSYDSFITLFGISQERNEINVQEFKKIIKALYITSLLRGMHEVI